MTNSKPKWMGKADLSASLDCQRRWADRTRSNVGINLNQPSGINDAHNLAAWSGRAASNSAKSQRGNASAGRMSETDPNHHKRSKG